MYTILVLYGTVFYRQKASLTNHLYAIRDYTHHRCIFVNAYYTSIPDFFKHTHFDLIVFHTTFMVIRWSDRQKFLNILKRIAPLKHLTCPKIAIPQDEYVNTDLINHFINEFAINHVFTVTPFSELDKIYPSIDRTKVQFHPVLTGYLAPQDLDAIGRLAQENPTKDIDVGYRAVHAPPWWGRQGLLKIKIAEMFQARAKDLVVDISTRPEDTFWEHDWYRFLLRCKYTIGAEGGSTILDVDGSVKQQAQVYLDTCQAQGHTPDFAEVEQAVFPGRDGEIHVVAISPRHLEACVTRTCQVLVEGHYNGILEPNVHYIPLKADFSDLDDVLQRLQNEQERIAITERAYQDIVASAQYTYHSFVKQLLAIALGTAPPHPRRFWTEVACWYGKFMDQRAWVLVYLRNWLLANLPHSWIERIRRWRSVG